MEVNNMKKTIFYSINFLRILIALILLSGFVSDIIGIASDSETYERVYTGEFLGSNSYKNLFQLQVSLWGSIIAISIYILFVILHITKLKQSKLLSWSLRIFDIIVIVIITFSIFRIRST